MGKLLTMMDKKLAENLAANIRETSGDLLDIHIYLAVWSEKEEEEEKKQYTVAIINDGICIASFVYYEQWQAFLNACAIISNREIDKRQEQAINEQARLYESKDMEDGDTVYYNWQDSQASQDFYQRVLRGEEDI